MPRKGENIYKRKDGRWEGRYCCGIGENGRKMYASVYAKSYRDVRERLIIKKNAASPCSPVITFERAASEWLASAKPRVKPSTYQNYQYLLKRHILPDFSGTDMRDLSAAAMQKFINKKLTHGRLKRKEGISKKYLRDILSIVKSVALFCEQSYEIISKIRGVTSPKPEPHEMNILGKSETQKLRAYLQGCATPANLAILISSCTGLRIGEVCGLKWEDFNEATGTLRVTRTVQRISDGNGSTVLISGTPKTRNSIREIPLPGFLWRLLAKHKSEGGRAIATGTCSFPEPREIRRSFRTALSRCGIKEVRYHDLRHPYVKLKTKNLFEIQCRYILTKVLDFPHNLNPVIGIYIYLINKSIC